MGRSAAVVVVAMTVLATAVLASEATANPRAEVAHRESDLLALDGPHAPAAAGSGAKCSTMERRARDRCGLGSTVLILFAPVLLVGLGIALLLGRALRQSALRRTTPEPVPPLVAEAVARMMLRSHAVLAGLGAAGVLAAHLAGHELAAVFLAIVPLVGLLHATATRGVLRRLEREDAMAYRSGRYLIVTTGNGRAHVQANDRVFALAERHRVPTVTADSGK